jgi:hypothetical protein
MKSLQNLPKIFERWFSVGRQREALTPPWPQELDRQAAMLATKGLIGMHLFWRGKEHTQANIDRWKFLVKQPEENSE